jgi:hypothetical protein
MGIPRFLTGILAAPLLLSACGGGDDPVADPPVSPSSTSASTHPPRETPEAFIRRWAAEDTRIQRTGNTHQFREMSQGCRGCTKLANLVDRIYAHGGYIDTNGWRINKIASSRSGLFDLYVFVAPTTYAESKSDPKRHLPGGPAHFQLRIKRSGQSWSVASLVQVAAR